MKFKAKKSLSISLISLLLVVSFFTYFSTRAEAGLLSAASVQLSDPRPSNSGTTYIVTYTFPSTTSIKCIDIIFANTTSNIVLTTNPGTTVPSGMTTTTGVKVSVTGGGLTDGSWVLNTVPVNGIIQYENSSGQASTATSVVITTSTNTNPSASSFYAQVATYSTLSTHTCSGLVDQSNVMAMVTTGGVATSVTVDPTLSFSVAGTSGAVNGGPTSDPITDALRIPFGSVPAGGSATSAAQLLTTSTNAASGYYIYIRNTQLLTNANSDTITAQTGSPGSPASFTGSTSVSSFGFTTNSTTIVMGSNLWAGLTTSNVAIDHPTTPQNAATVSVEYKLQLKNVQPPGTYSNVITYTATPTY